MANSLLSIGGLMRVERRQRVGGLEEYNRSAPITVERYIERRRLRWDAVTVLERAGETRVISRDIISNVMTGTAWLWK